MAQANCFRSSILPLILTIEKFRRENDLLPTSLSVLTKNSIEENSLKDAFGNYYSFESIGSEYRIFVAGSSKSYQSYEKENLFIKPISSWLERNNQFKDTSDICKGTCPWPFCKKHFF
jgi:hypothetical protein